MHVLAAGLAGFVLLDHVADDLEDLAAHALAGKPLRAAATTNWCWPASRRNRNSCHQPLGRELHDGPQRRGSCSFKSSARETPPAELPAPARASS